MFENYKVTLNILTPVIINTGESFDFSEIYPTQKIGMSADMNALPFYKGYQFNTENLFEGFSVSEKIRLINEITTASMKRDNEALSSLRMKIANTEIKAKTRIPCRFLLQAADDLRKKPLQKVDKIMQMGVSGYTYIPGSSIKGAIRTAILEGKRADQNQVNYEREKNKNFEIRIISNSRAEEKFSVSKDPFKYIKVSDFSFSGLDGISYIGKIGDDEKMPIYSAMTNAYVLSGKPVIATGNISIDTEFFYSLKINPKDFKKYINDFYWQSIGGNEKVRNKLLSNRIMKPVVDCLNADNPSALYFRLGHYIGIQNYTFNVEQAITRKIRNPRINMEGSNRVVCIESGIVPGICLFDLEKE